MPALLLAAACAVIWGVADFSGGKASQRARPLAVTVVSQVLSLPVLLLCLLVVPGTPTLADLSWGAAAGVAGVVGIALLYRALSSGAMAVAAPVTAVTAAVVPMAVGIFTDQLPRPTALIGAALALVAIALVSLGAREPGSVVTAGLIGIALAAGACFGVFTALLGQTGTGSGMWALVGVRASSIAVGLLLALRSRTPLRVGRRALPWTVAAGVLDLTANACLVAAAARGHLSIVAAIASLYPASTVLLALLVDRERLRPAQLVGLGLAATALVLAAS